MASNRKQPFGYELRGGRICLQPEESDTVRWVFEQYVAGFSYAKLTEALEQRGVPYLPDRPWNKNMVARMLEDIRYEGTEDYPTVVDRELMEGVLRLRGGRAAAKKLDDGVKVIQRLAVCGLCGEKLIRIPHVHGRERWNCPACKRISRAVTDAMLTDNVTTALKRLISSPSAVRVPLPAVVTDQVADRMEQELRQKMTFSDSEESELAKMAFNLAAARYAQLDCVDYETEKIRRKLDHVADGDDLDSPLLRSITDAILVHPNGNVQLRLKNNQII